MIKAGMKNTRPKIPIGGKDMGGPLTPEFEDTNNKRKMKNTKNIIDPISVRIRNIIATNNSVFMFERFLLEFT